MSDQLPEPTLPSGGEATGIEPNAAVAREAEAIAGRERSAVARGIAISAVIVGAGQLLSRLMGLVRETVIADVFGATGLVSCFTLASRVPDMTYQLLLGGMVSAALVPVLSEYAAREDQEELAQLTSTLLTVAVVLFSGIVLLLELLAPVVAVLLGGGFGAELLSVTTRLVRIILPSLIFFGAWGVAAGVLYARQSFVFPALASAVYNLGIVLAGLFLAQRLDIAALSVGVVLGSLFQLLIVLPGLRGLRLRPRFDLRHPALRRILLLYGPVVGSIVVQNLGIVIDGNLASRTVDQALSWMRYATQLYQLPLGLVSVAVATAALPTLARLTGDSDSSRFRHTLAGSLRLVIVLVAPAVAALVVLGQEGIRTVLEHGVFQPADTSMVYRTLLFYLPGLPFAAIDQLLVFAFYARKDTLTPVLVYVASMGAYLIVGPLLAFGLRVGFLGLVIANAVQLTAHCLLMWIMLERRVGSMAGHGLLSTAAKATLAAVGAGLAMFAAQALTQHLLPEATRAHAAGGLLAAGSLGAVGYLAGLALLRVEELSTMARLVRLRSRE